MDIKWTVIRKANQTAVTVGPFEDYDVAQDWADKHSNERVKCEVTSLYSPDQFRNAPIRLRDSG